jgi:hypothetical protein
VLRSMHFLNPYRGRIITGILHEACSELVATAFPGQSARLDPGSLPSNL